MRTVKSKSRKLFEYTIAINSSFVKKIRTTKSADEILKEMITKNPTLFCRGNFVSIQ